MSENQQTRAPATGEPGQAAGGQAAGAAEGGLDLSLGHIGTHQAERRWFACCDACQYGMSGERYQAAETAAGPEADPRCPRCDRSMWSFHPED